MTMRTHGTTDRGNAQTENEMAGIIDPSDRADHASWRLRVDMRELVSRALGAAA
jgi:hypothetical protein